MEIIGNISKLVANHTNPVSYWLSLSEKKVALNAYLGKTLRLEFMHAIHCVGCNREIKKSYQNGYCFVCIQTLAQCDLCIIKPERCHFHLGTCREPKWGETHCMTSHYVYLANASGLKVGITRSSQVPTRWIDQGASEAILLFEVPTRQISGLIEVLIAKIVPDKTNWRKMLMGVPEKLDLEKNATELLLKLQDDFEEIHQKFGKKFSGKGHREKFEFHYPVFSYPQKITSLSFDKNDVIEGTLLGIKGQYLLFDKGVINIRKHSGYLLKIMV